MTCYYPLKGFWTGCYTENGKKDYIIVSNKVKKLSYRELTSKFKSHKFDFKVLRSFEDDLYLVDPVDIPCGCCIGCRLEYSRQWALRCVLESQQYDYNYFLTLTYDDLHLPVNNSLCKRDIQLFMKRLRKFMDSKGFNNIRYFLCGEYGESSKRPHYHIILFNCPLPRLVPLHDNLLVCEDIYNLWPYGYHTIGEVNFESCAYVARYVMKKVKGINSTYYEDHNLSPEFVLMSRKPGIGSQYFNNNYDKIYKLDSIYLNRQGRAVRFNPPKYFDKLYQNINNVLFESVKSERQAYAKATYKAVNSRDAERIGTYDVSIINQHNKYLKEHRLKLLIRSI